MLILTNKQAAEALESAAATFFMTPEINKVRGADGEIKNLGFMAFMLGMNPKAPFDFNDPEYQKEFKNALRMAQDVPRHDPRLNTPLEFTLSQFIKR